MKSLSSSRREVLVDCFHVYTYHIGYLLPGSAVLQHSVVRPTKFIAGIKMAFHISKYYK